MSLHNLKRAIMQITRAYPSIEATTKDGCLLLRGELDSWDDIVRAGYMAAEAKSEGVINEIRLKGYREMPMRISPISDKAYDELKCDVLIIGGGVIGSAILREFCKYEIDAVLIEKENDVALHASSRNDGCIHVGIDLSNKSMKHRYLRRAVGIYESLARDLGVDYHKAGQTLAFTSKKMRLIMPLFIAYAKGKGIVGTRFLSRKELFEREPNINPEARYGVFFPEGAVISPYNMVIALAENALENGGRILLETAALSMEVKDGIIAGIETNRGTIRPRVVINAAGVFSDVVAKMAGDQFFTIHPRRGVEIILDKKAKKSSVNSFFSFFHSGGYQKAHTKGGGVGPTVDGNILIGPTAAESPAREDYQTTLAEIDTLIDKHRYATPKLNRGDIITYFAGIRAATYEEDFIIRQGKWTKNIIHAAGIQSPGLTAAPAIAEDIVKIYQRIMGASLVPNPSFNPRRKLPPTMKHLDDKARDDLIKANPDYGQIVCRCEEISKGEIIAALHRPLAVNTVDGIKRRVRAGMGRCQGGFCQQLIVQIMASERHVPSTEISKKGNGHILLGDSKEGIR